MTPSLPATSGAMRHAPCAMPVQLTLISEDLPHARDFLAWRDTPGARHILRDLFTMAARYHRRFLRTHQRVSVKLLWEIERDRIRQVRYRFRARYGQPMPRTHSYALNNNYHAHLTRFMLDRRPEWAGLFEQRELGRPLSGRRALLVNIRKAV